jgi:hypothetical protein
MLKKSTVVCCLILLIAASMACDWMNMPAIERDTSKAGTAAATQLGSLRATSSGAFETMMVGGQTQVPEVLTSVAQQLTRAVGSAEPIMNQALFGAPNENYTIVRGCTYASKNCLQPVPHTGLDSVDGKAGTNQPVGVMASGPGTVMRIQALAPGCSIEGGDCGLGNTVILEHILINGKRVYSLYAHLDSFAPGLQVGTCVKKGQQIGIMGASGYGDPHYWKNRHLHMEFKIAPVLGDPRSASANPGASPDGQYFGYIKAASDSDPDHWGYYNPLLYINEMQAVECGR